MLTDVRAKKQNTHLHKAAGGLSCGPGRGCPAAWKSRTPESPGAGRAPPAKRGPAGLVRRGLGGQSASFLLLGRSSQALTEPPGALGCALLPLCCGSHLAVRGRGAGASEPDLSCLLGDVPLGKPNGHLWLQSSAVITEGPSRGLWLWLV